MLNEVVARALKDGKIAAREDFHLLPSCHDRAAWDAVDPEARAYYAGAAEAYIGKPVPSLPASLYMEFVRVGDRKQSFPGNVACSQRIKLRGALGSSLLLLKAGAHLAVTVHIRHAQPDGLSLFLPADDCTIANALRPVCVQGYSGRLFALP